MVICLTYIEKALEEFPPNLAVHDNPLQEITLLEKSPKYVWTTIFGYILG